MHDTKNKQHTKAQQILEDCPENCDKSCYRCLRSYKNKIEHGFLDRHIGAILLNYFISGTLKQLNELRLQQAIQLLANDLQRQTDNLVIRTNEQVHVSGFGNVTVPISIVDNAGKQFIVDIVNPLTPAKPSGSVLEELTEFSSTPILLMDELTVRSNLPFATLAVLDKIGW